MPVVGGGIGWAPGTDEKDVVRRLVIDLEARRTLYSDLDVEGEGYVTSSVRWMRDRLSETLKDLSDGSEASERISELREDCNDFLTAVPDAEEGVHKPLRPHAAAALQQLRESFRVKLAYLGKGDLDRATALAERIPHEVPVEALDPSTERYPVRLTCVGKTDFHPSFGYHEYFEFEVFNTSDHPVTVRAFGLEFTMYTTDEWHEQELASRLPSVDFPLRLEPRDGVQGWIDVEALSEDMAVKRDYIVAWHPFVDVPGHGKRIVDIKEDEAGSSP